MKEMAEKFELQEHRIHVELERRASKITTKYGDIESDSNTSERWYRPMEQRKKLENGKFRAFWKTGKICNKTLLSFDTKVGHQTRNSVRTRNTGLESKTSRE